MLTGKMHFCRSKFHGMYMLLIHSPSNVFLLLKLHSRVKSLSKGSNPKKDMLPSTLNLKEPTNLPLPSALPTASTFEVDTNDTWPVQVEKEEVDASEEPYYEAKTLWKRNGKLEQYNVSASEDKVRKPNGQTKLELPKFHSRNSNSDDDLNALLQVITTKDLSTKT